ncbi:MAG TPA: tetratricopeptide repeat protein [Gemmatimonadales bacterium]|nr:tetratricopeptide repeat protein [Gemmatimonadales bacterium]
MNLEKLKDTARKFEQKEDWRRAIEVYLKAIQQIESGLETSPDLSLYNRVGDLYLRTNDTAAAVRSYERAVDLYADQGFFNNAIALCGKILRVNPGRTQTYLKLAQLHARKNVVIEAKRNLIEFLERMNALGQLDQAFVSVKGFADQFSGSQEIRLMLVELLRATSREDEAREQLEKLAGEIEDRGERLGHRPYQEHAPSQHEESGSRPPRPPPVGLVFLDTGVDRPIAPPASAADVPVAAPPDGLLLSEPIGAGDAAAMADESVEMVPGLEQALEVDLEVTGPDTDLGLERVEPAELEFIGEPLEGMDESQDDLVDAELLDTTADDLIVSVVDDSMEVPDSGPEVELDLMEPDLDEVAIEGREPTLPGEAGIVELESLILDDPDNPELHLRLADRLLAGGEDIRGLEELELALAGCERLGEWPRAAELSERLVVLAPDAIRHHQKRVELAFRSGERAPLLAAYLALGDALARAGATEKAMAVFGRVHEHDPGNAHAIAALAALRGEAEPVAGPVDAPPAPAPPAVPVAEVRSAPKSSDSFVDLGSLILDEGSPRDTRMRIDRADPKGKDEQREFQEILEQFKRGIEQNLDSEDYEAHYDLGIAFKEMGLLDEAIAEFQKALRSPEGRLRTSEALGICFYDKGQFGISETVLRRAVETDDAGDEAKIGLLYWLGRAAEAQGKELDAITSYERALAVDIRFMDLSDRVHRLAADRRE